MPRPSLIAAPYVVAVLAVVLATAVRLALNPLLGTEFPFATLFLAVLFSAWYGGRGPALTATILGAMAAAILILPSPGAPFVPDPTRVAGLSFYLLVAVGIAALGERMHTARLRAEWDMAAQARAESARREFEERFRLFMEHLPGLAWIKDREGRYVYANDAAVNTFRRSRQDLYGKTDEEVFPPSTAAQFRANDRLALSSPSGVQAVETLAQEDGRIHHSWVSKFLIPGASGQDPLVGGMAIDITEHRIAEETLRESEERLRLALDAGRMGSWEWRIGSHQVTWSPGLEAIHGLEPGSFEGTFEAYQSDIHPEDREYVLDSLRRTLQEGKEHRIEYRIVLPDGTVRWVEGRGKLLVDENGRPSRMVGVCMDVDERKRTAVETARLYDALRDADRRKDEFLALLGHELRNPLAPISNALQLLKLPGADPAISVRAREMIERQVEHLVRVVDDLLDMSRIMRGRVELRREPLELAAVVARAVETSQPILDAEGHTLSLSIAPEPVLVDGDAVRLAQVVSNLLHNAAKYTARGGTISLSAAREGDQAVIRVNDTGAGIAPEIRDRIFDMFYQGSRGENLRGGLGIGLSVVKGLTELHGGTVEVHSEGAGRGSEFIVRLPLLKREEREAGSAVSLEGGESGAWPSRRVLVVDDNRDAAESLALLLRLEGLEVMVAYDAESAHAIAVASPPQVAFLDLGLPSVDGYELARRFQADPALRGVALVALTGWGQPEDRQRTREAGFARHLVKPVPPATLRGILAELPAVPGNGSPRRGGDPTSRSNAEEPS
ncbi:MAG TPA: ATP-binding protein [Candidatus Eisenbacteria bacterium]|nr:ATP-binding protein [Candidatus Eisenbacteria bacterium]